MSCLQPYCFEQQSALRSSQFAVDVLSAGNQKAGPLPYQGPFWVIKDSDPSQTSAALLWGLSTFALACIPPVVGRSP